MLICLYMVNMFGETRLSTITEYFGGKVRGFTPIRWNIDITKVNDKYKMRYVEILKRPDDVSMNDWLEAVRITDETLKKLHVPHTTEVRGDVVEVRIEVEGELRRIASLIVGEFIPISNLGEMRIRDLALLPAILLGLPLKQKEVEG